MPDTDSCLGQTGVLCAGAKEAFLYSRKDTKTQRNRSPLGLTSGGLGGLAALRALYFFSLLLLHSYPLIQRSFSFVTSLFIGYTRAL